MASDDLSIEEVLERARAIADRSREEQEERATPANVCRVAGDLDAAHVLAEYTGRPVRTEHAGYPVTIWPIGKMPPLPPHQRGAEARA